MESEQTKEKEPVTMRTPFPSHQISKLPKPTKAQTDEVKADFRNGIRCDVCGAWHHPKVVHLDYVGHAALTDRLLDVDPLWSWEPVAMGADGLPAYDGLGGLWIRLTVGGVTRLGYGHAGDKHGGDAIKEIIGDALRNAAMRFGAALELWHKGSLHTEGDSEPDEKLHEVKGKGETKPTGKLADTSTLSDGDPVHGMQFKVAKNEAGLTKSEKPYYTLTGVDSEGNAQRVKAFGSCAPKAKDLKPGDWITIDGKWSEFKGQFSINADVITAGAMGKALPV